MIPTGLAPTEKRNVVRDEKTNARTKKNTKTMYLEIHPYWYDAMLARSDTYYDIKKPEKSYYKPGKPQIIRLDTIRRITPQVNDKNDNVVFKSLVITEDYHDNIIVSAEEAEIIEQKLISLGDNTSKQLERMAKALESLCEILSKTDSK